MAQITAALVKQLREMTDSPMMECKKALVEADGDIEKAVDVLRTMGLAKAIKRAGRDTNEGTIAAYVTDDGPKLIPNSLGKTLTPSAVGLDSDGSVLVDGEQTFEGVQQHVAAVHRAVQGGIQGFGIGADLNGQDLLAARSAAASREHGADNQHEREQEHQFFHTFSS